MGAVTIPDTELAAPSEPFALLSLDGTGLESAPAGGTGLRVLLTTVVSDSHTWNLVFLQLALEELGYQVINLGPCVPPGEVVEASLAHRPDLVVVSTVNGHGQRDGMLLIDQLREQPELAGLPVVIGGKLGISGLSGQASSAQLQAAGYDRVFDDNAGLAALQALAGLARIGRLQ